MAKYPKYLYHPDQDEPATAKNEQDEEDLRRKGFDEKYSHKPYPRWVYHVTHTPDAPRSQLISDPGVYGSLDLNEWSDAPPDVATALAARGTEVAPEQLSDLQLRNAALTAQLEMLSQSIATKNNQDAQIAEMRAQIDRLLAGQGAHANATTSPPKPGVKKDSPDEGGSKK